VRRFIEKKKQQQPQKKAGARIKPTSVLGLIHSLLHLRIVFTVCTLMKCFFKNKYLPNQNEQRKIRLSMLAEASFLLDQK
jgi:hypothetical protein